MAAAIIDDAPAAHAHECEQCVSTACAADGQAHSFVEARDVRGAPADRVAVIIARTAQRHDVTVADILGTGRQKALVAARREALEIVARVFPHFSTPHLARIFQRRDHTSILWLLGRTAKSRAAKAKRG